MHIGLLEDDIAIQEMLRLVLQDEGYSVIIFPTAEDCLNALVVNAQTKPSTPLDLLIVDWRLPGSVSGTEVIHQLRDQANLSSLPIILTTAATFSDTEELQTLDITLLEKPFAIDDIVDRIKVLTLKS
ncbi:MAG TPA: response regulator [Ktedonobacteraceae bacterium]|nr:response regulator [Ktedonobacteraceae bacterium]